MSDTKSIIKYLLHQVEELKLSLAVVEGLRAVCKTVKHASLGITNLMLDNLNLQAEYIEGKLDKVREKIMELRDENDGS